MPEGHGRKRIASEERRQSILAAARSVFASHGYDGAKTSSIARAAHVSEALLYRHFPSKEALYQAVMQSMVEDQDRSYEALGLPDASAASLIHVIRNYMASSIATAQGDLREGLKVLLASLGGDGSYANAVYERAMTLQIGAIKLAFAAAKREGVMQGHSPSPENAAMFIEHVGTMLAAGKALPHMPYSEDGEALLDTVTRFCCRGIGLTPAMIDQCINSSAHQQPDQNGVRSG